MSRQSMPQYLRAALDIYAFECIEWVFGQSMRTDRYNDKALNNDELTSVFYNCSTE